MVCTRARAAAAKKALSQSVRVNKAPKMLPLTPLKPVQGKKGNRKRPAEGTPAGEPNSKRIQKSPQQPGNPPLNAGNTHRKEIDPVAFWALRGHWPEDWSNLEKNTETGEISKMEDLISEGKIMPDPGRWREHADDTYPTPSDEKPRQQKNTPYAKSNYRLLLKGKGSYMDKSPLGITEESKKLCNTLLKSEQPVPANTLFDDDIFERVCDNIGAKNEARVIQDVSRLLVPSVEQHSLRVSELNIAVESVNEGWNASVPLFGSRPQPDYSAGFQQDAFTQDQISKLSPLIGDFILGDQSFFMATAHMYFPFLTCEVKCSNAALEIADRQNAHSMTLAVRGVVELFRAVGREKGLNRQILAFSVSHDHKSVNIYGHYPEIDGKNTKYYRHPIRRFDYVDPEGGEKWTAYRFTKNVYDKWVPEHFARICAAIDQLPDLDFEVPALSEVPSRAGDSKNS